LTASDSANAPALAETPAFRGPSKGLPDGCFSSFADGVITGYDRGDEGNLKITSSLAGFGLSETLFCICHLRPYPYLTTRAFKKCGIFVTFLWKTEKTRIGSVNIRGRDPGAGAIIEPGRVACPKTNPDKDR